MLLSLMRKHAKSWIIKFLIGIIAVVFIFYFGYSFRAREGIKVANVNGEVIGGLEYDKTYRNLLQALQRDYGEVWSDNLIKAFNLKRRALDKLIDEKLISQEAKRIGLDVTEKEIQERILSYPAFQFQGRFDESRYRLLLQQNRMEPEDFEAEISRQLLREKISQFLTSFTLVTEKEILDYYTYSNEMVKVNLLQFKPEDYKGAVEIQPEEMKKYFGENREDYRIPEKIRITYIPIDPSAFKEQVKITEQQIRDYYEENIERFKEEKQVKARHILFRLSPDAMEEKEREVKGRARAVLEKAKAGEDFASLAKEYSEGPTKDKGGDLGYFSKGQMVKAFDEAVFKLKKGEISDLVKTSFGYHIIKVEDIKEARTKGLDEVKKQIRDELTNITSMDLAHEKALSLVDQMPYDVDLEEYARENDVSVKQSDYFALNEPIPDIGDDQRLKETLFAFQKGDVTEVVESGGTFYIIQVSDKKPSYLPQLEEVEEKIKEDFRLHLARLEAKKRAEGYLEKLKAGQDWESLLKENNLKPKDTGFVTRRVVVPEVGYDPKFVEVIFGLDENRRYPEDVFESPRGIFVIRWEGKKGIDKDKYEEEKETYRQTLIQGKQQEVFQDWLANLRERAEIEVLVPMDQG
ncbi:MAG: SurA N-terminal domain-containing protein [Deltaproteobacteria bacterium]|nr:SurA N-terminal domain-containing protein [Deltaproteobacteria bacterium]